MAERTIERRFIPGLELRVTEDDSGPVLEGLAAPFGKWSEDLGGFREQNMPGAFKKTIKESDIRGVYNHNNDLVFGRTSAGTLKVWEDKDGMRYSSTVDSSISYVADMMKAIQRGDITGNSYAMQVIKDEWSDDSTERSVLEARLFELGPQVFPAYPDTTVQTRAEFPVDEKWHRLNGLMFRLEKGGTLQDADLEFLQACVDDLRGLLPVSSDVTTWTASDVNIKFAGTGDTSEIAEPQPVLHSVPEEEPQPVLHSGIDECDLMLRSKSIGV